MENAGVVGETMAWVKLSGLADGFNGVDVMASMASMALLVVWWLRWRRWRCWWFGGVDGVDWRRSSMVNWVFDTEGTDVEVPLCPQW